MALSYRWRHGVVFGRPLTELLGIKRLQRSQREIPATGIQMQADFEAIRMIGSGLGTGQRRIGIKIRSAAHALPVFYGTVCRTCGLELIEAAGRAIIAVVVARHDHDCFFVAWKIPKTW